MRFSINILKADPQADIARTWTAARAAPSAQPGFVEAKLHRVYKQLNRDGYSHVSMEAWSSPEACGKVHTTPENLYEIVNQGRSADWAPDPGNLIVTNPYRIPPDEAERHAEMWDTSKRHMETREGFVDAYLFRAVDKNSEYFFVSRAEWRSEELFMRQFSGKDFKQIVKPFEGIFAICLSHVVATVKPSIQAEVVG
ncbi:hypothetical protein GAY28_03100 [Azospirillum brasilense]|uniref:antibiotic biosynthesis monooxygenase family protein n=1 Tax=Azospirillum brasilense TaxID=192 RepID=UPI000E69ED7D|nr:antibiotic biosynthesis monooxygenase family protein [Azospirillum brasilense]NUB11786.1 hypothetical protein [Azospirillum brasilense]NUB25942.1 hypothetical protein [Azospirillum brasilense]NUB35212.1 hypothetical protein [Azospirillum brasilense]RIW03570.1 hypothetical protein D2T81_12710 [Azospirillum brasilense]